MVYHPVYYEETNMNTFVQAVTKKKRSTTTENGMHAFKNSGSKLVDLFFSVGASRGKDISGKMLAALTEDKVLASQLMLWGARCSWWYW
jgi:hypothetical protein